MYHHELETNNLEGQDNRYQAVSLIISRIKKMVQAGRGSNLLPPEPELIQYMLEHYPEIASGKTTELEANFYAKLEEMRRLAEEEAQAEQQRRRMEREQQELSS